MFSKIWTVLALAAVSVHLAAAKSVVAHFMLDNSYAYTVGQWKTDMKVAQQAGIDGFSLNWIPPDCNSPSRKWQVDRIDDAFQAAEKTGFKLMFSFDMSYTTCNKFWNTTFMTDMITKHAGSSAAMRWNTNILVSTYAGDKNDAYGNQFFQDLKESCKGAGHPITLAPALVSYAQAAQTSPEKSAAKMMSDYPAIDGYFNWQAWPLMEANMTCTADKAFKAALTKNGKTGPYIMAVSPWQYKDLNNGVASDSWVAYSDTLFAQRLHSIANNEFSPDIIEVLTWNDFCESHYLRDLPSMTNVSATDYVTYSNGMENYVEGMNHAPWRVMAKYYLNWWKNGKAPVITMDQVVYWYRVHPKAAACYGGSSSKIKNYEYPTDAVFAWALVKDKATVSVSVGANQYWEFEADSSGPALSMIPFPKDLGIGGTTPEVSINRNNKVVQYSKGGMAITASCSWSNFNAHVELCGEGVNKGPSSSS
ncbi:glycoside hydrolase [Aureobasidium pullulans]|uniref:Glycoside hydrolase n=1 Tax=Aureobasidium pullulans TaxID=5580 RepID=A0A4S9V8D1_AURPU|nr:glycoside hydrolase [Aureobasidium pullulans]THZ47954.1 glycoside hydrolase [Aureobasidium pullulans]THZ59919.1 glycoside hydrolase [Aureobasidium pullulans]THZ95069.1 glycoside hydrolase [Aureobasidium pullulans]